MESAKRDGGNAKSLQSFLLGRLSQQNRRWKKSTALRSQIGHQRLISVRTITGIFSKLTCLK